MPDSPARPPRGTPEDASHDHGSVPPVVPRELARSRWIARIMDSWFRIPGTQIRVGLDPLLGFVPGLGDWIGWLASSHLLWSAWRIGAPATVLLRMTGHLLIDGVVGTVPVIGDLFDIGWRANVRNLRILERQASDRNRLHRESRWLVGGLLGAIAAVGGASVWLAVWVFSSILGLLGL